MMTSVSTGAVTPDQLDGSNGVAVLLLHGLCANPLEMLPLSRTLHRAGYTVRTPLVRGLGVDRQALQSPSTWQPGRWQDWLAEAETHLDELAARHTHVAIAGLCIGAVLALALAARRPVDSLMLVSPTLYFDGWNVSPWRRLLPLAYLPGLRGRMSFAETAPYGIKNERLRKWMAQAMASEGLSAVGAARLPASSLCEAERLIRHVRPRLNLIDTPTLVMHATEDDVASPRSVHTLQQRLGRQPEVVWFSDSYHMLTLDNEREAVCATAQRFLREHLPGRPVATREAPLRRPEEVLI